MLIISTKPSYKVSVAGELSGVVQAYNVTKPHLLKAERSSLKQVRQSCF